MNYREMMEYVENTLHNSQRDRSNTHPFRSRANHSKRVLKWAERLCENRDDINKTVLYVAAIFHDIGYAVATENAHQIESASMFREYALEHDFDNNIIDQIVSCIEIHSDKWKMEYPEKLTIEQLLLMEADLLDEEGAMAICWDNLSCGYRRATSYEEAFEHSKLEWHNKYQNNPMVTTTGKILWKNKQEFVKKYLEELGFDLQVPIYEEL